MYQTKLICLFQAFTLDIINQTHTQWQALVGKSVDNAGLNWYVCHLNQLNQLSLTFKALRKWIRCCYVPARKGLHSYPTVSLVKLHCKGKFSGHVQLWRTREQRSSLPTAKLDGGCWVDGTLLLTNPWKPTTWHKGCTPTWKSTSKWPVVQQAGSLQYMCE